MPVSRRGDEDRVVTGDGADDLAEARRVQGDRESVRRTGRRTQHDEIAGEIAIGRVVLAELAQAIRSAATRDRRRRRVRVRAVVCDLDQTQLDDVARNRRLRGREARRLERPHEVALRGQLLRADDAEQRLLPMLLARELLHAVSNTVPTRSPASSRSTASPARASTI